MATRYPLLQILQVTCSEFTFMCLQLQNYHVKQRKEPHLIICTLCENEPAKTKDYKWNYRPKSRLQTSEGGKVEMHEYQYNGAGYAGIRESIKRLFTIKDYIAYAQQITFLFLVLKFINYHNQDQKFLSFICKTIFSKELFCTIKIK